MRRTFARSGAIAAAMMMLVFLLSTTGPVAAAPSRSRIVWAGPDGIWTSDSSGGERRHLVGVGAFDHRAYNPRWSHDGQWIAYMQDWMIWVIRADGTNAHTLATRYRANLPQWSADDQRIYYQLFDGYPGIEWVSLDGQTSGSLPRGEPGTDNSVTWSPDGRTGALSIRSGNNYAVATMDTSGGNRSTILAQAGSDLSPVAWSADGRKLLVEASNPEFGIVVVNADGSAPTTIRRGAVADAWSPDGKWILFHDPPIEAAFLRIMRADGSGEVALPDIKGQGDWGPGAVDPIPVATTAAPTPAPTTATSLIAQPAPTAGPSTANAPTAGPVVTVLREPAPTTPTTPQRPPGPTNPAGALSPPGPAANTGPSTPQPESEIKLAARSAALPLDEAIPEDVTPALRHSAARAPAVTAATGLLALAGGALVAHVALGRRRHAT